MADAGPKPKKHSRRRLLKVLGTGAAVGAAAAGMNGLARATGQPTGPTASDAFHDFFQAQYRKMTPEEIAETLARLERRYRADYGVEVTVENTPPIPGVVFGYALNISKCRGYRDCVHACAKENNLGRDPEIQYIRVLELDRGSLDLHAGDHHYKGEVPAEGKFYLPVQCQQCENPPCVQACPVDATWKERDGVVVVDYDWCIGCRYCQTACPYEARHFNWSEPSIAAEQLNESTHYLSNRPRPRGVVEKCTNCLHRTRKGKQPACQEACPTGARVFGNLLDPKSEIRFVLENKTVFRLKEELKTEPKFWYYTD